MDTLHNSLATPRRKQRRWLAILILTLAVVLLYYSLRNLNWASFWQSLRTGQYQYLLVTLPIAGFSYILRALRWRFLVKDNKELSPFQVFWANMIGYLGNLYLPARAGELFRSALLGKETGKGTSFVLATALTERIIDAVALVVILAGALLLQNNLPPLIMNAIWCVGIGGIIGLFSIFMLPHQEKWMERLICHLPLPKASRDLLKDQLGRFLLGMRSVQSMSPIIKFLALTVIIWWIDGLSIVVGARILSETLSLSQALILLAALGLSSAIPSTPGYIGVYQFVAVSVLVPFGFSHEDSLAYIVIIQISGYMLVTGLGLVGLWQARLAGSLPSLLPMEKRT